MPVITGLLRRDPELGGASGTAASPFEQLCDSIVDILLATADNMDDTGAALVMGANEYAKTDQDAAAMYKELRGRLDAANGRTD
ncbi:hypothetical protein [Actinoplanes subtropicus]|uniref:hypothetical protein n=1 Tax=Actinoplanes subtropicus TaxID=543632 RepID=UPI0012F7D8A7|nr:hypothetical protein [Actinoplanes subtropicus]